MIAVERIQETVYLIRLSEQAMDEAITNPFSLSVQLQNARELYTPKAMPVPANGHTPGPKKSPTLRKKLGGVKAKKQKQPKDRQKCPHCTMSFSRPKNMANHIRYLHPTEADLANG